jgi:hypothetical protein
LTYYWRPRAKNFKKSSFFFQEIFGGSVSRGTS